MANRIHRRHISTRYFHMKYALVCESDHFGMQLSKINFNITLQSYSQRGRMWFLLRSDMKMWDSNSFIALGLVSKVDFKPFKSRFEFEVWQERQSDHFDSIRQYLGTISGQLVTI